MSSLFDFDDTDKWDGVYEIVQCKRALSPSGLPDMDYSLNPYGGCAHGCIYCYAPEVTHSDWDTWRVVRVKSNVVERLTKELTFVRGTIGIGTVTDPYQPAEKRFQLTRQCLQRISRTDCPIHMHTKSDLILRDIDILSQIDGLIAVTITSIEERWSKITEPGAPMPAERLDTLAGLTDAGLNTYALIGPVLSHLEGKEEMFADAIADTGVRLAYIDRLNNRPLLNSRLSRMNIGGGSIESIEKMRRRLMSKGVTVKDVFERRTIDDHGRS